MQKRDTITWDQVKIGLNEAGYEITGVQLNNDNRWDEPQWKIELIRYIGGGYLGCTVELPQHKVGNTNFEFVYNILKQIGYCK